jgi:hypothetical protein
MKKLLLSVAVAALACTGAQATVFTVTMTGIVDEGINYGGFGDVLGDLTGQSITVQGVFDTDLMTHKHQTIYPPWDIYIAGGTVSVTVNGMTRTVDNPTPTSSVAIVDRPTNGEFIFLFVGLDAPSFISVDLESIGLFDFPALDVTAPLVLDTTHGFYNEGTVQFGSSAVGFTVNRLEIADVPEAGVPEPASWAMMVGGFGLIGGALRGRRKAAVSFG